MELETYKTFNMSKLTQIRHLIHQEEGTFETPKPYLFLVPLFSSYLLAFTKGIIKSEYLKNIKCICQSEWERRIHSTGGICIFEKNCSENFAFAYKGFENFKFQQKMHCFCYTLSTPWLQAYTKASASVSLPSASVLLT